jgi:carbon monoxide dehydrogenase subunit G
MRFENAFEVQAPIDEVYETLLDVERVAPCLPGAQVLERTNDDAYKVAIKVKVGPIQMTYRGEVEIVERDAEARRAVMRARAREARGQGTAEATVEMRLEERDGTTHGTIAADVQLSGRAAAMGQGVIQDVSAKLVEQFSRNLQTMLASPREPAAAVAGEQPSPPPGPHAVPPPPPSGPAAAPSSGPQSVPGPGPHAPPPPPHAAAPPPPQPEESALSAVDLAGAVIAGRLKEPKNVAGLLGVVALIAYLLGRRRR